MEYGVMVNFSIPLCAAANSSTSGGYTPGLDVRI